MRLVGLPDAPLHLEIPGITITGATGFGQSGYPERLVADELGLQEHLHGRQVEPPAEDGRRAAADVRLGARTRTTTFPAYSFSSLLNFADDEALQMSRYVDPRTGEPSDGVLGADADRVGALHRRRLEGARPTSRSTSGLRYENYGTFKDTRRHAAQPDLRLGLDLQRAARNARASTSSTSSIPTDNNNLGPRLGFAWDPKGDGKMSVRGGYGLSYDRLMNLPAENYRNSPPLRATVVLGQFFGTPQFTYSLGDPSKPYLGYPVDPALQVGLDSRNGVIGARVALTTVDPNLRNPVHAQLVLRRAARDRHGRRRRRQLPRQRRPQPVQRLQHQSLSSATCWTARSTASTRASSRSTW